MNQLSIGCFVSVHYKNRTNTNNNPPSDQKAVECNDSTWRYFNKLSDKGEERVPHKNKVKRLDTEVHSIVVR
jgi:hypothetical protein